MHTCLNYRHEHPHAAWAAYVGLGRADTVLLSLDAAIKDRQLRRIMAWLTAAATSGSRRRLDPKLEQTLSIIVHAWLAFTFEVCQQHLADSSTDTGRLADACAHMLLDILVRLPGIPAALANAAAAHRH